MSFDSFQVVVTEASAGCRIESLVKRVLGSAHEARISVMRGIPARKKNIQFVHALVDGGAGFRAFIAHIGSIPPSPIIPPSPVIPPNPIRYQIGAQITVGGRFLTDVTPVVTF